MSCVASRQLQKSLHNLQQGQPVLLRQTFEFKWPLSCFPPLLSLQEWASFSKPNLFTAALKRQKQRMLSAAACHQLPSDHIGYRLDDNTDGTGFHSCYCVQQSSQADSMKQEAIGPIALLCAGAVFNLTLIISLHRTWRHWNQMKWYIVMLTAGNTLEVLFTLTTLLGSTVSDSWLGGDVSCKFLMFMNPLGPSIANMALAALALHTLLTAITGCQGNSLRHVVVLGLFALLTLPLPLSKIPIFGVVTYETFNKVLSTCTDLGFFHEADPHYRFYYFVAGSVALVFFPLIVIIGAIGGTFMLSCCLPTTENEKSEKNTADVVLTTVLGTILMLLCVPLHVFIFMRDDIMNKETVMVYLGLVYVFYSKVSLTALVCVIFAYAHVYRKGVQKTAPSGRETGERTKLMK